MSRRINTGKGAESLMITLCGLVENRREGCIVKVDPPTTVVKQGGKWRPQFLPNPFLDFTGVYRGQPIHFEVKDIDAERLPVNAKRTGGLSVKQAASLRRWHAAGSLTGLIWFRRGRVRFFGGSEVIAAIDSGAKSLPWETGHEPREFSDIFNHLQEVESNQQTNQLAS